jgi:hypothetical protein
LRVEEERATLRRVLALRKLGLKAEGEARIDACADLATLQRWHDQAVLAASADEALSSRRPPRTSSGWEAPWDLLA